MGHPSAGPRPVADAGPAGRRRSRVGAARGKIEALVRSTTSSTRPDASVVAAEDRAVKLLARRISENSAEIEAITAEISALLEGDDTYRCLLTVPGIGPKTASELAISIDIEDFPSHDRLASYCGFRAAQPPVGDLDLLGDGIAPRQQEAEEPAHILMQLPYPDRGEMGRLLHQVPRAGHVARQGAQGAGAKETEGHLRGHARQGALRSLAETHRAD